MTPEDPPDKAMREEAVAIVRDLAKGSTSLLSPATTRELIEAVARDLGTAAGREEQLAKLKTQSRVLSDVVITTKTSDTVPPDVRAVNDERFIDRER